MKKLLLLLLLSTTAHMLTPIWKQSSYIRRFTSTLIRLRTYIVYTQRMSVVSYMFRPFLIH